MNQYITIGMFLLSISVYSQQDIITNSDSAITTHDFSELWCSDSLYFGDYNSMKPREEPFGYIGNNYQRLRIHFISVIKNQQNLNEYFVYGKSKVKNNICDFQGVITISKFSKQNDDSEYYGTGYKVGLIEGEYKFYEDPKNLGTGIFYGTFETKVCIDNSNFILYDWQALGADGYRNNQFEGNWKSYKSNTSKICNWGDYRIPNSDSFDMGAAELSPNPKFYKYGWEFYEKVLSEKDKIKRESILKEEFKKWWER